MALPEHLAEFERRVTTRLADAVEEMRRSLHAQAERASSQLLTDIEAFRPELPQRLLEEGELAGLAAPSHEAARRELVQELLGALAALDAAATQSDALQALLAAARAEGGRAALWLTQEEALVGWASAGFAANGGPDPLAGRRLAYSFSPALERLARGRGVVRLDRSDAARLASELEVAAPHAAILVPLVLRDRLAAALYVDRADGDVEIERVQLLSYAAAQRLELQALSTRSFTPTLVLEENAPAGVAGLPLWSAEEVAAAVTAEGVAAAAAAEPAVAEPAVAEPEVELAAAAEAVDFQAFRFEPEAAEPASTLEPAGAGQREGEALAPAAFDEPVFELAPPEEETLYDGEPDTLAEPIPLGPVEPPASIFAGEAAPPPFEAAAADIAWEIVESEPVAAPEPAEPAALEPTPPAALETAAPDAGGGAATGQIPYSELWAKAPPFQREISEETPLIESTAEFMPPPQSSAPSPQATQTIRPGSIATHEFELPKAPAGEAVDLTEDATVLLSRAPAAPAPPPTPVAAEETVAIPRAAFTPAEPVAPPPPAMPVDDEPTVSRARTTEVLPPPDVQGPGWAFTSSRVPRATGENALHEEARRLARLLISEIKLYNEEQVEEGRRNRDVYHRLKDDIDRSRQIYEERVHESVRTSTDYFQQELVRSLAGGDPRALGI